jgi:hypothetical protein
MVGVGGGKEASRRQLDVVVVVDEMRAVAAARERERERCDIYIYICHTPPRPLHLISRQLS